MMPDEPARLCTSCHPTHIENCPTCYGFGVQADGGPVSARNLEQPVANMFPCPTCRSDYRGAVFLNGEILTFTEPRVV